MWEKNNNEATAARVAVAASLWVGETEKERRDRDKKLERAAL